MMILAPKGIAGSFNELRSWLAKRRENRRVGERTPR
jgi:hypothetical protein